ncbi:ubiquitin-conjugating enzyme/RWD-like protein, partial [Piptocephalis cylindrospora]
MSPEGRYNRNSPSVKRILRECKELAEDTDPAYTAEPLEDNLFEWHFTVRGPEGTAFEGGRYHGRILLPADYPFKPPSILFLTPSGRFEINTKICLTITGFHPEFWQPAWGVRTALLAIISFFPQKGEGAVGALDYRDSDRKEMARASAHWKCSQCESTMEELLPGD